MKFNYTFKRLFKVALPLYICTVFAGCEDDAIVDRSVIEFGTSASTFTVSANAGHIDLQVLSNQSCDLSFDEEITWAGISEVKITNDGKFFVDYDDNPGFPRMAKILVSAKAVGLTDTIILRQKGLLTPSVELSSGSLLVKGSDSASTNIGMETNLDFESAVSYTVNYTGGEGDGWIEDVYQSGDDMVVKTTANSSSTPRSATLNLVYDNGWGEDQTTTLYVTQKTSNDELGTVVPFNTIMNLALSGVDVKINDYYIISGYVVSDKDSRNAGDNTQTSPTSIDYTICDRTVYFESEDGSLGFNILTSTTDDNVFNRYDHVQLLLKDATIHYEEDPDRYEISGVTTAMIIGRTSGTRADIPVKEKYINELTDEDMYTFVTLKDCEFPVRKGALTPIHDGYTLSDAVHRMAKYPRLMRDINGSSIYLYTNTTCPYRRDGRRLPYGSGKISGVVVFEYFKAYVYGDGIDEDSHGRIGTYQLRHQSYDDIQFDDSESFSEILTEYRYVKGKKKAADGYWYWYPTYGSNGSFSHTNKGYAYGCYICTSWNYLGWTGTAKGISPFRNHIGDDGSGQGIILEDGSEYKVSSSVTNTDGKGQELSSGTAWTTKYWWEKGATPEEDKASSWIIEFSTEGITTDHLSMQMAVQGGQGAELRSPIFWKAEYSIGSKDLDDASIWHLIAEYQVPDFPIWANYHEWQLPAYKQIDFPLPLELLGHEKVYIRLTPTSKAANSSYAWNAADITDPYTVSGNAIDYFAIRYNK